MSNRRGVISEFFDLAELEKQRKAATDAIGEYIELVKQAAPIRVELRGAESVKSVAEGAKKLREENNKAAAAGQKLVDITARIDEQTKKANKTILDQATETAKIADTYKDLLDLSVKNELAQKQLAEAKKAVTEAFKEGNISEQEYLNKLAEIKDAQIAVGVSQQEVTRTLKNIEKGAQAASGSLEEMKAQLALMQQVISKLDDAAKNSEWGKELIKQAEALANAINEQKKKMGDFSSNVGRYAESLAHGFEMVTREIERLKRVANDLEIKGDTRGAEQARRAIAELDEVIKISNKTGASYQQTVGALNKEFINMAAAGNQSKEFLEAFQKFAIESKKEAEDLRKEIKRLGSDTRQLDDLVGAISLLASTYELAAGAAALFGADNEDLERTIKKIVAVQSVANGIREIANQITEKGTVANRLYAWTQLQIKIAMDATATSAARLQAALGLIGLALTVVGALVTLMYSFNKELFGAADNIDKVNDRLNEMEREAEETAKALEKLEKEAEFLERLSDINLDINFSSDFEKSLLRLRGQSVQLTTDIYNMGKAAEEAGARASEAVDLYTQNASRGARYLDAEYKGIENIPKEKFDKLDDEDKKLMEAVMARQKEKFDYIDKQNEKINDRSIVYRQIELAKVEEQKRKNKDLADSILDNLRAEREAAFELFKYRQELLIEEQKARVNAFDGEARVKARKKQADLERELLIRTADFELKTASDLQGDLKYVLNKGLITEEDYQSEVLKIHELTASQQLYIRLKLKNDLTNLDFDRLNDIQRFAVIERQLLLAQANQQSDALAEIGKKQEEEDKQRKAEQLQFRIDDLAQGFVREQRNAELTTAMELKELSERYKAGIIQKEEYEKKKLQIENKSRKDSILAEIAYYQSLEKLAATQNISSDKQKEIIQALHDLKIKLLGAEAAENEETEAKRLDNLQKLRDAYQSFATELSGLTFDLFTNAATREKNAIQDQIDLLEKQKQKAIEVENAKAQSAEERAAAITVIEARAAAQREQLEQRQRQLDQQKARFERARSVAQIIANTAQGVTAALASIPPNPVLAAIIGAIGAAQLVRVLAQPIPRYFRGRDANDPYAGPAWVDDGGRPEAILRKGGDIEIGGNKPRMTWLNKGDIVLPDARKALLNGIHENQERDSRLVFTSDNSYQILSKEMREGFAHLSKTIERKKEIHFEKPTAMQRIAQVKRGNREYFKMNGFEVD